ncbi:MAG TPA: hypothetical protein DCS82_00040 [Rhodospirillaceae bacterium]|nr:hypothetical protein [Rhodospirillaceae bacterium]HAA91102.1 hypothetical protein [Rhodospirillaceae bacterium]HAT34075.1 hypothetical protein [Rhodospirillaceae bacterium]|tara:strand:+ start:178 stop:1038 length:861 start_codon:yes stop_codon:yes gene_type:complete
MVEIIEGRESDLGDFTVRRVLPTKGRQMIGPFIFFDHMGPLTLATGQRIDVRPHPHIGLATVTYLFRGEMVHRDSLGSIQSVRPGDINWMTAGRGIVHSERTATDDLHKRQRFIHGIQAWVALPVTDEETEPEFHNHSRLDLPLLKDGGVTIRLLAGSAYGSVSPVKTFSPMFYADVSVDSGASLSLPDEYPDRGFYLVEGNVEYAGKIYEPGQMVIAGENDAGQIAAKSDAQLMLLGGTPLTGEPHIWWNFVSSRPDRIEQAKQDWAGGRFVPVPGESDFIPLPQ